MFTTVFDTEKHKTPSPKEGELYRRVTVSGKTFELYYGFYEEFEREYNDPIPIYPDLVSEPEYTDEGIPIVTGMQDTCEMYSGKEEGDSCSGCSHFQSCEELFGLCTCPERKKKIQDR